MKAARGAHGGDPAPRPGPDRCPHLLVAATAAQHPVAGRATFAAEYGVPRPWIVALETLAILCVIAFAFLIAFPATRLVASNLLIEELGPVELTTFGCFLGAALLLGFLAHAGQKHGERSSIVGFRAGLALFCLLVAMEEISWGQSLFPFNTPAIVESVNEQGEFNLHNLVGLQELGSLFVLALGIAGLVGTGRDRTPHRREFGVPGVLVPLLTLVVILGAADVFNDFVRLPNRIAAVIGKLSEAVEMCLGLACLITAWLHHRRAVRAWRAVDVPDSAPASAAVERVAA